MKKWIIGAFLSVIVMPILVFSWGNIRAIWAAPQKVEEVKVEVKTVKVQLEDQNDAQKQIAQLVVEQQHRQDKQEAVYNAQIKAIDKQIELIAEIKKKK